MRKLPFPLFLLLTFLCLFLFTQARIKLENIDGAFDFDSLKPSERKLSGRLSEFRTATRSRFLMKTNRPLRSDLCGIESNQDFGQKAKKSLSDFFYGKTVIVTSKVDKNGVSLVK